MGQIGLYQLHHVDPDVPLPDSVGALEELRQEGKIAAVGLSNVTAVQLDQALAITLVATVQNQLSYRPPDDLPTALACGERGIAYLAYKAFAGTPGAPPRQCSRSPDGTACPRTASSWRGSATVAVHHPARRRQQARVNPRLAAPLELTDLDLGTGRRAVRHMWLTGTGTRPPRRPPRITRASPPWRGLVEDLQAAPLTGS